MLTLFSSRHKPQHARLDPSRSQRGTVPFTLEDLTSRPFVGAVLVSSLFAGQATVAVAEEHRVAEGESLSQIAEIYGIATTDLVDLNGLDDPDLIISGTVLDLPDTTHVVVEGESLWSIAELYEVPVGALARANGLEGADPVLLPGDVLELGAAGASTATRDDAEVSEPPRHTVSEGETLWAIAQIHGTSVAALLEANGWGDDHVLAVGAEVTLPEMIGTSLPEDLLNDPDKMALLPTFDRWAAEYGVPADLLKSLAWFESGWNNEVISSADAIGIGQLLPITADFVSDVLLRGEQLDPFIAEQNIQLSARFLRYLLDETDSVELAVASYYQGLTATRQHGIYNSSVFYVEGIIDQRVRFQ